MAPCPHIPALLPPGSDSPALCRLCAENSFFRDRVDSFLDNEKVQKDGDAINKEKGTAVMAIAQCWIFQK